MEKQGYIKLYRSMLEWEWFKDVNTRIVFEYCLLCANYSDQKFKGKLIKRGSFITSYDKIAKENCISKQNVRTAIKHLISTHELTHEKMLNGALITVINYNYFQENNTVSNTRLTLDQHSTNIQLTPNNNKKNKKNVKNDKNNTLKDIVEYLNLKTGKSFKATSKQTIEYINARLDEGFTVDDFKKVIDVKTGQWKNDKKMNGFLRPQTLFSPSKFESYLNEGDTNETIEGIIINGITQV